MREDLSFIPNQQEELHPKVDSFDSLDQLTDFLQRREHLFWGIAAEMRLSAHYYPGWQLIQPRLSGGVFKFSQPNTVAPLQMREGKRERTLHPDAIFTADNDCDFMSSVLYQAINPFLPSTISMDIVALKTDRNRENWESRNYDFDPHWHTFLRFIDERENPPKIKFVDPSYGQIDSRLLNRFLIIAPEETELYYKNPGEKRPKVHDVDLSYHSGEVAKMEHAHPYFTCERERLVALMTP